MWSARLIFLAIPLLLSGCGFHPLYGGAKGDKVASELADVYISPIADRPGQILRNDLIDRMHPGGEAPETHYNLVIYLSEARSDLGLQRDATATYARIYLYAKYYLYDAKTQAEIYHSQSTIVTSFALPQGGFVNLVSESDARERALDSLSDEITSKVAVFLRNPPVKKS